MWLQAQPDDPDDYGPDPNSLPCKAELTTNNLPIEKEEAQVFSAALSLSDFVYSDTKIQMKCFGTKGYHISDDVRGLYRDLNQLSLGIGAIPQSVKSGGGVSFLSLLVGNEDFGPGYNGEREVLAGMSSDTLDDKTELLGVLKIWNAALKAKNERASEFEWNLQVHTLIMNLALRDHWNEKGICHSNITTAGIEDASLLPNFCIEALQTQLLSFSQSKLVDHAIILNGDSKWDRQLRKKLLTEGKESINHADAEHIDLRPIAISMLTKRAAIEEDVAQLQLGVWVAAHFERLRQLARPSARLPTLPLLFVQGHEWKLKLASVRRGRDILILEDIVLGRTSSGLGSYQILAALRRLARWVDEDYRTWFEEEVLSRD